jgi:hypothetical protein
LRFFLQNTAARKIETSAGSINHVAPSTQYTSLNVFSRLPSSLPPNVFFQA